jgi:AcrR family transcriptional regulator
MARPSGAIAKPAPSAPAPPEAAERARLSNKGERTRQRIKAAFSELLEVKSFTSVTIADICRISEITVGGFYFHFASQEDLLDEVMAEYVERLIGEVDAALAGSRPEPAARAVCQAFLKAYSERSGLARTFQQLTRMRSDYAARWRSASEPAIARLGETLRLERPGLTAERARFLAYALVTMIISKLDLVYVYREHGGGAAPEPGRLERDLVGLWGRMVHGGEAA